MIEANWGGPQYPNASTATDPIEKYNMQCEPGCLYNVAEDPYERNDLAKSNPQMLQVSGGDLRPSPVKKVTALLSFFLFMQIMLEKLAAANKTIWNHVPGPEDPACDQAAQDRWGGFLGPWQELPDL